MGARGRILAVGINPFFLFVFANIRDFVESNQFRPC
jgi:hypothetical protein